MSTSPKTKTTPVKGREPPPALFLHPSPAASTVSIPGIPPSGAGLSPTSPGLPPNFGAPSSGPAASSSLGTTNIPPLNRQGSLLNPAARRPPRLATSDTRTTDRTDALWAEMQATLEEVELSASGGTHVFGPDHDRKLVDLRAAQIALAQAWARSEADDAGDAGAAGAVDGDVRNLKSALVDMGIASAALGGIALSSVGGGVAVAAGGKSADTDGKSVGTASLRPGSSAGGDGRMGHKIDEETEADILLARKRREANDHYFSRVDQGVRDVVAKLEEVAVAMRAVEQESRDIWGDESAPSSARG